MTFCRTKTRHHISALCAAASLIGCDKAIDVGPEQQAPGRITVLDTGGPDGDTGWWPSLAMGPDDRPHLSYCDAYHGDLRYATRENGRWRTEPVLTEGAVGKYTALAVSSRGEVGIAFYDQDQKYLRYAWQTEKGTWRSEKLAWGLEVGMAGELRFDARDEPHLFYYVGSGKLVHAHRKPGASWHKEVIANVTGGFSVRISPILRDDGFWLSYVDWTFKNTTTYLARPMPGGSYRIQTVATRHGPGWRSQLLFENGAPVVLYGESFTSRIKLARQGKGSWQAKTLLPDAANFAAQQAKTGDVVVVYEDITNGATGSGTVKYLRRKNNHWRRYAIDHEGPAGSYLALALDSAGRAIVAYYSALIRGIKVYDEAGP